ncbi:hypothetical protein MIB92_01325 [Aestuariirhabdus sp. Z084]|uniref:hypothetical protein n=1 Tax=Aestuariirhabdus haliotis TaxID=2918751 RepID=UPI00201B42C3|nr:hypothetical protein [Aestuariirhabdus haliotis]MCL6414279.1 hypothetical protein [Aestuariirhabdus haliotis]MCL6418211.1 hypothetical protein [Aestuariirhabdus haliotis]
MTAAQAAQERQQWLVEQIKQDIRDNRLTTPQENNAMQKLALLSDPAEQQRYRRKIAHRYVQLAERELDRNNYIQASSYAIKAEEIADNADGLKQVRQRIQSYREQAAAVPIPAQIPPPKSVESLADKDVLETLYLDQSEVAERKFELRYRIDLVIEKTVKRNALLEMSSQNEQDARWLGSVLRSRIRLSHPHFDLVLFSTINTDQEPRFRLYERTP